MAQEILMPKLGNTVELVVIVEWRKDVGDSIALGETLCEVETDKTTVDVEAEAAGTLLAKLYEADDDVPVLTPFAIIGEPGEDISSLKSPPAAEPLSPSAEVPRQTASAETNGSEKKASAPSPRARMLAASSGMSTFPASGSGPGGRVIERDVRAALEERSSLSPAAAIGDGDQFPGAFTSLPVRGVRQVIAQRMHASLQETAQLTLNTSVNAESMLFWRAGFKNSPEDMDVAKISINHLIMFTTARVLARHPELNATFQSGEIRQYRHVHLGFAVDTPRGLMVPVLRYADRISLLELSVETRRLAAACREAAASPDVLTGGTFTITNLGSFGIETFTPVLNTPEAAILGVGSIVNAPIEKKDGSLGLEKRMGLSLTIDHQVVDGAPAARFLKDLTDMLAHLEWVLAGTGSQ